ncbi:unnamed protein product [Gadus morhua 'NCC']
MRSFPSPSPSSPPTPGNARHPPQLDKQRWNVAAPGSSGRAGQPGGVMRGGDPLLLEAALMGSQLPSAAGLRERSLGGPAPGMGPPWPLSPSPPGVQAETERAPWFTLSSPNTSGAQPGVCPSRATGVMPPGNLSRRRADVAEPKPLAFVG